MKLTMWLKERELNARRLAAGRTGADRAGWLEDADHFQAALTAADQRLAEYEDLKQCAANNSRNLCAEVERQKCQIAGLMFDALGGADQ